MPTVISAVERNDVASTFHAGSAAGGPLMARGIARAGTSSSGIGAWFQGTYGAILLNADGTFSYRLDHDDPDTNVLGTGQTAEDRFTYTYVQGGVEHTDTIVVRISGIDEPNQNIITASQTIKYQQSATIAALDQINVHANIGVDAYLRSNYDGVTGREIVLTNLGSIRATMSDVGVTAASVFIEAHWEGTASLINHGLIEAISGANSRQANGANVGGTLINDGVIRAVVNNQNVVSPQAFAAGATVLINNGLIEALSEYGEAQAFTGQAVTNNGLIYARGGTQVHPRGIVGVRGYATGTEITNHGTIHAEGNGSTVDTQGISLFSNSTGVHSYGTVRNSGMIVADMAIVTYATSAGGGMTALHVTNTGRIEGRLSFDMGQNIVANRAGGTWVGAMSFGLHEDTFFNAGTVVGDVDLSAEDDLFDGRGGSVSGAVRGGDGMDILIGGNAADRLEGGNGDDRIAGGGGGDQLVGGAGANRFVYFAPSDSTAGTPDTILDFKTGVDRLDLSALAPLSASLSASGGTTTVTVQTASGQMTILVNGSIAQSDLILSVPGQPVGTAAGEILVATQAGPLAGHGGDDVLIGSAGNDVLDGGSGADLMRGGAGDDIYLVDSAGDRHIEMEGEGIDEVRASVDYSLHAFVENLTLVGTGLIGGGGNRLDNVITGNDANNELYGREGNDTLIGGGGRDRLEGGDGNDRFVYRAISDSTAAAFDEIVLFKSGQDKIDLTAFTVQSISWVPFENYWTSTYYNHVTVVTSAGDLVIRVHGNVTLGDFLLNQSGVGTAGDDVLTGTNGADTIHGFAGNDRIDGLLGADQLFGDEGNDRFVFSAVSTGATTPIGLIDGGADDDTIDFRGVSPVLLGTIEVSPGVFALGAYVGSQRFEIRGVEHVLFGDSNDTIGLPPSFSGTIELRGGGGNDDFTVSGSTSAYGEDGDDTFTLSGAFGTPARSGVIDGGSGNDLLKLNVSFAVDLAAGTAVSGVASYAVSGIERVQAAAVSGYATTVLGSEASEVFEINPLFNDGSVGVTFAGRGGDDILNGSNASDHLEGGAGADTLAGNAGADLIDGGDGFDTVSYALSSSAVVVDLGANQLSGGDAAGDTLIGIEAVEGSAFADQLTGSAANDALHGGAGNDNLDGGAGADAMNGGAGDDTYAVDDAGDRAVEAAGQGNDRVLALASYALTGGSEVELLFAANFAGTGALDLTGNEFAQIIIGNEGVNSLYGLAGNDSLYGLGGNDALDGGAGADVMFGGAGDDIYGVDDAGDQAIEAAGEGNDRVYASVSFRLGVGREIELLTAANPAATNAFDLAGNDFGQIIIGNDGVNTLEGLGGDDALYGFGGNDALDGGVGADVMFGGTGDDTYSVDDAGDQAIELPGEGNDRIYTSVSFALGVGREIELLFAADQSGTGALDLTGNDLAQIVVGSDGANNLFGLGGNDTLHGLGGNDALDGGSGADVMFGGAGDDAYAIDAASDHVVEQAGAGFDRVLTKVSYTLPVGAEIELFMAYYEGGAAPLDLNGNDLAQIIIGNAGANALGGGGGNDRLEGLEGRDILDGGLGADTLVGGEGVDLMVFTTALGGGNIDTIVGFQSGTDGIALFSPVFVGLNPGSLPASAFVTGTAAQDADDRIIYDPATGALFFDPDGNGASAAIAFARLDPGTALAASDFLVI